MSEGLPCGREIYGHSEGTDHRPVCLMHSTYQGKSPEAFQREIDRLLGLDTTHPTHIKIVDFTKFIFPRIEFSETVFTVPVIMTGAQFTEWTSFKEGQFKSTVRFDDVHFRKGANFRQVRFHEEANFESAHFEGVAHFGKTSFDSVAIFTSARFESDCNFAGAHFHTFLFNETQCEGNVRFTNAEGHKMECTWAAFDKHADFDGVKFEFGGFSLSSFTGGCQFGDASISNASFYGCTFGQSSFRDATLGNPNFSWARWKEGVDFWRTHLLGIADFRDARFDEPRRVRFYRINRSRDQRIHIPDPQPLQIRLTDCMMQNVALEDVNWNSHMGRLVLQDELELAFKAYSEHELIAIAYRRLVNNFELSRQVNLSEDCFVGAMEMTRLDPNQPRPRKVVTTLYKWASEYGSNYIRALKVLGGLLLFFASLYALPWSGLEPVGDIDYSGFRPRIQGFYHLRDALFHSLDVATFQRVAAHETTTWFGHLVRILETIFVPGQLALFFLALRRRFRR